MSSAVGLNGLGETNEAGEQLKNFCLEHQLALANTMFKPLGLWVSFPKPLGKVLSCESEIRAPPQPLPYLMPIPPNTLFYNK